MAQTTLSQTFNTPADLTVAQAVEILADYYGYTGTDPQGNPETRAQFVQRYKRLQLKQEWQAAKRRWELKNFLTQVDEDADRVTVT